MSHVLNFISRVCMSAVFIAYGLPKLLHPKSVVGHPGAKRFFDLIASGTAVPTWFGYVIGAVEFFGGIAILLGIKTRWVASAFVLYLILVTAFTHPFWMLPGLDAEHYGIQKSNFYKNLAIIGAFLMLAVQGGGAHSVDSRMSGTRQV